MLNEKDPRFSRLELKIGVMAAVALAGMVLVLALIGMEKDLFTKKYRVWFVSASGSGFVEGMPVKLSGFKIGRVRAIELTDDARVRVVAEVNRKYDRWLREGARARLMKEGFIGDAYVEIVMGDGQRMLDDGDMLPFEKTGGIEELVEEAKPILREVGDIIQYIGSPEGDIKVMLGNLRELSAEVRETRRTIDEAVGKGVSIAERLEGRAVPVMESAASAMKSMDEAASRLGPLVERMEGVALRVEEASATLPGIADKADEALENLRAVTETLRVEAPRMRQIIMNADEAARDGRRLVRGASESWPMRLMLPPPAEPGLVPLDAAMPGRGDNGVGKD